MAGKARTRANAGEPVVAPVEPVVVAAEPGLAVVAPSPQATARYLAYMAGVVLLMGLFEPSDMLSPQAVALLVAVMVVIVAVGLTAALQLPGSEGGAATPSQFLLPAMAVIVAAAVSLQVVDWRLHVADQALMAVAVFGAGYVTAERVRGRRRPGHEFLENAALILVLLGAYVSLLAGVQSLGARVVLIFLASLTAAYIQLSSVAAEQGRALAGGFIVSLVATAIAFGLISAQFLDLGRLATILLVAWYVNTGMVFYLLEGTMTRNVFLEYLVGILICVGLVATAILTH
ncbi:MAG TPA: hypothetical protein VNV65_08140 [Candidatus Solibacter sp.]|jgi:hypothetical protein|nr:hypothetical protein [Candidatus Solibacter sp.]